MSVHGAFARNCAAAQLACICSCTCLLASLPQVRTCHIRHLVGSRFHPYASYTRNFGMPDFGSLSRVWVSCTSTFLVCLPHVTRTASRSRRYSDLERMRFLSPKLFLPKSYRTPLRQEQQCRLVAFIRELVEIIVWLFGLLPPPMD
jgi:hypothetical protein